MGMGRKVRELWRKAGEEARGVENLTELITRVAMLVTAGWILAISWLDFSRAPFFVNLGLTVALIFTVGLGIANLVASVQVWVPARRIAALVPVSIIYLITIHFWVFASILPFVYGTDGMAYSHYSAILVLQGKNPYATDLSPAFDLFPIPGSYVTPTETGSLVSRQTYPALSFLVYVPLVAAGLSDMRLASLAAHALAVLVIYRVTPSPLKSFGPLTLAFFDTLEFTPGSVQDILWVTPMVLSASMLNRRRLSGALYGIACSLKPIPWLIAPYLFVYLWKRDGTKLPTSSGLWAFVTFASGSFFAFNGPFIAWDPSAWTEGVLDPLVGMNVPLGSGLSLLTQGGWVSIPRGFYFVALAAVAVGLLVIEVLDFPRAQYAMWSFPAIAMFFGYRSLQNYFTYWYPLAFLGLALYFSEIWKRGK